MEKNEVLIKVEGLSKKYCKDLKTSLWYGVKDLSANVFGVKQNNQLRDKEFWAIKNIDFELRKGECLGLIGHNGAGKSTLLKILNGLINPDEGKVTIKGKVGALIELGAGFNPILTGRENIYNNAAVLGFSKKEVEDKIEQIIDFSEIRPFIDMPVQNYSSGMKVRLGFAVAAQMEPDVLLIDEVLAVGDVGFRMKCLTKIGSMLPNTAVIFVSHTMPQVSRIANKILLMENGLPIVNNENISLGIEKYYQSFSNSDKIIGGNGAIDIKSFSILNDNYKSIPIRNDSNTILKYNGNYILRLTIDVKPEAKDYWVNYSFIDKDAKQVANLFSLFSNTIFSNRGIIQIDVSVNNLILGQGIYNIGVALNQVREDGSRGEIYLYDSNIASIQVVGIPTGLAPIQFSGTWNETEMVNG